MFTSSLRARSLLVPAVAFVALIAACSGGTEARDSAAAAGTPSTSASTDTGMAGHDMAGHDMSGMAAMTGNADQDFLRMMNDHHKGLLALTAVTKTRTEGAALADARKLDSAQTAELDHMTMMLRQDFKDSTAAKTLPRHQAMADSLRALSGTAQDRAFYRSVIAHHQEGSRMLDEYLPKVKNAMVKGMAEQMKAAHTREIAEFERKLAAMGA